VTNVQIAAVCHEANRAYCAALGDASQVPFEDAPAWQRESAIEGVARLRNNPSLSPRDMHQGWLDQKLSNGWKFGTLKDADAKTHPCCVAFEQLPVEQQRKDFLFSAIVSALTHEIGEAA